DGETGRDREKTVRPLDPRRRIERRKKLAVAERPVGASETRSRDAHHTTPHDDEKRGDEARVDESAIAGGEAHVARRANARRLPSADARCGRLGFARSCMAAGATWSPTRACRPPTGRRPRSGRS